MSIGAATVSSVDSTTTSTTLLADNKSRSMFRITNTDANVLYVKFGATASATSFTARLLENETFECPRPVYTGLVSGVWATDGSGAAIITYW